MKKLFAVIINFRRQLTCSMLQQQCSLDFSAITISKRNYYNQNHRFAGRLAPLARSALFQLHPLQYHSIQSNLLFYSLPFNYISQKSVNNSKQPCCLQLRWDTVNKKVKRNNLYNIYLYITEKNNIRVLIIIRLITFKIIIGVMYILRRIYLIRNVGCIYKCTYKKNFLFLFIKVV